MYLLDTDTFSLYLRGEAVAPDLVRRLRAAPGDELATSVITAEEVLRGRLDLIRRD